MEAFVAAFKLKMLLSASPDLRAEAAIQGPPTRHRFLPFCCADQPPMPAYLLRVHLSLAGSVASSRYCCCACISYRLSLLALRTLLLVT
jgi:hypothetical protein